MTKSEMGVLADLEDLVINGCEHRVAFIGEITGPGSLCHAVRSEYALEDDFISSLATITIKTADKLGLTSAIKHHIEFYTEWLTNNHFREGSTSALSNAVDGIRRQATSDYIRKLKYFIIDIEDSNEN